MELAFDFLEYVLKIREAVISIREIITIGFRPLYIAKKMDTKISINANDGVYFGCQMCA